jgi:hypothetical protein
MVGDTVIAQYLPGADAISKVVAVSYTWSGETFEGTVDILPVGGSTVRTVDVNSVRVMFFDSDARARFVEEPQIV